MSKESLTRNWVFTLNNPEGVPNLPSNSEYVYQLECGESGTPHYQGYIRFPNNQRLTGVKKILPTAHWEPRLGTHEEAYAYCTKLESRLEEPIVHGFAAKRGERSDLRIASDLIKTKRTFAEVVQDPDLKEVRAKYPRWVREEFSYAQVPEPMENVVLRTWQTTLMDILSVDPDPRKIIWVYDPYGNAGKSWMARYLRLNHQAMVYGNGKTYDVAYSYDYQPIVVFDLSRSQMDSINYGPMEDLKNGYIFSGKYESVGKSFRTPHVVVMANFQCPPNKFSVDRLYYITLVV